MEQQTLPKGFGDLIRQSDLPVLVDFWAEWCGACKMVSPVMERIALEFKGKLVTVKVNVDRKSDIAGEYQITSIPTIVLFHKGEIRMRHTGDIPYEALKREIELRLAG